MYKSILSSVGAACFLFGTLWAEETGSVPQNVPPQPPMIARAPAHAAWIIQFQPKAKAAGKPSESSPPQKEIKQQTWTKSGSLLRCQNEWTDGTKTEDWIVGGTKLCQNPQTGGIQIFSPLSNAGYHDFNSSDFERLDWLTQGDYVSVVQHNGEPCYLFRARTLASSKETYHTVAEVNAPNSATSVFVNVRTHLPVAIVDGEGEYQFQFVEAPSGELKVPAAYASVWKLMNHR